MKTVRIGYIPLVDAAIPIVAAECGFAEAAGIKIELVREVSWSNIRDKLLLDLFDAAHMLAPLAVATSLGFGHIKDPLIAPFALNTNGNCITIAASLYRSLAELLGHEPANALESARAMGLLIKQRKRIGAEPLTFGVVFPYSVHAILIRHWLRLGGVDVQHDVQFLVVPPPYMATSLSKGVIEGYCVGEPWNSRAVETGVGCIAAFGAEIAAHSPDKMLGLRGKWAEDNPDTLKRLLRALKAAALWCESEANHESLAGLLAQSRYLNVAPRTIMRTFAGKLAVTPTQTRPEPEFINLGRGQINRPDPRQALWVYAELTHLLGRPVRREEARVAASVFRRDLFDEAIGEPEEPESPDAIALTYGPAFDSNDLQAYLDTIRGTPNAERAIKD